jgi:hypothetical protein
MYPAGNVDVQQLPESGDRSLFDFLGVKEHVESLKLAADFHVLDDVTVGDQRYALFLVLVLTLLTGSGQLLRLIQSATMLRFSMLPQ